MASDAKPVPGAEVALALIERNGASFVRWFASRLHVERCGDGCEFGGDDATVEGDRLAASEAFSALLRLRASPEPAAPSADAAPWYDAKHTDATVLRQTIAPPIARREQRTPAEAEGCAPTSADATAPLRALLEGEPMTDEARRAGELFAGSSSAAASDPTLSQNDRALFSLRHRLFSHALAVDDARRQHAAAREALLSTKAASAGDER